MKKLVAYITSGYPEKSFTTDLALSLGENGVDILELGIPFSDPVADGPLIEKANHKSLELGFKFEHLLEISKVVAPQIDTYGWVTLTVFTSKIWKNLQPKQKSYM